MKNRGKVPTLYTLYYVIQKRGKWEGSREVFLEEVQLKSNIQKKRSVFMVCSILIPGQTRLAGNFGYTVVGRDGHSLIVM